MCEYARLESDALAGTFDAFIGARNSLPDTGDPVGIDGAGERQDAALAAEAAVLGTDAVVPLAHQRIAAGVSIDVRGVLLDPYERIADRPVQAGSLVSTTQLISTS